MHIDEQAVAFTCGGEQLIGIVSLPARQPQPITRAVLIVVGGPQYRAGSHRQFTLLARDLVARGHAVLRFDYRGMGDSSGQARDFAAVGDDLRAAIDQLQSTLPEVREVVLWGLCDGAAAALLYAHSDPRVSGLMLVNPWARTETSIAKTTLRHYYLARLRDPALWRKIAAGQFHVGAAATGLMRLLRAASARPAPASAAPAQMTAHDQPQQSDARPLPQQLRDGLGRFRGPVLLIIGSADLTGQEFMDMATATRPWRALLAAPRVTQRHLAGADHTFSRPIWHTQLAEWSAEWLASC